HLLGVRLPPELLVLDPALARLRVLGARTRALAHLVGVPLAVALTGGEPLGLVVLPAAERPPARPVDGAGALLADPGLASGAAVADEVHVPGEALHLGAEPGATLRPAEPEGAPPVRALSLGEL